MKKATPQGSPYTVIQGVTRRWRQIPFSSLPLTRRMGLTMQAHRIFHGGGGLVLFSPIEAHFLGDNACPQNFFLGGGTVLSHSGSLFG